MFCVILRTCLFLVFIATYTFKVLYSALHFKYVFTFIATYTFMFIYFIIYLFFVRVLSIATKHSSSNNNYNYYSSIKPLKTTRRKKGEHAEKPEFARVVED